MRQSHGYRTIIVRPPYDVSLFESAGVSVLCCILFYTFEVPSQLKTRIDVYETLCPQQMLVHKGGKIKNWGGECRDVTPTKLQSQNIFKESTEGGGVGLGGGGGGVRMDVNEELKFL